VSELETNIVVKLINEATAPLRELTNGFAALKQAGKQAGEAFKWGMELKESGEGATRLAEKIKRLTEEPLHLAMAQETALVALRRSTGLSGEEFDKLRAKIAGLGEGSEFSGAEITAGLTSIANTGADVGKSLSELPRIMQLATAAHMPLAQAADVTAVLLKKFGGTVADTAHYTDMLARAAQLAPKAGLGGLSDAMKDVAAKAQQYGVSFDTSIGLVTAFAKASGNAGTAASAFDGIYQHITSRRAPTQMKKAFEDLAQLGIHITSNTKDIPALLDEVTTKTAGLSAVGQGRLSQALFGNASILNWMRLAGPGGIGAVNAALKENQGALKESAEIEEGSAEAAHKRLEAASTRLSEAIGGALVPGAKKWDDILARITDGAAKWVHGNQGFVDGVMHAVKWVGWLAGGVGALISALGVAASTVGIANLALGATKTASLLAQGGILKLIPALFSVALPFIAATAAIVALSAAAYELYIHWEDLKATFSSSEGILRVLDYVTTFGMVTRTANAIKEHSANTKADEAFEKANARKAANAAEGVGGAPPSGLAAPSYAAPLVSPLAPLPSAAQRKAKEAAKPVADKEGALHVFFHVDEQGKPVITKTQTAGSYPIDAKALGALGYAMP
jgi:TP901 family phage tail tape measure protein